MSAVARLLEEPDPEPIRRRGSPPAPPTPPRPPGLAPVVPFPVSRRQRFIESAIASANTYRYGPDSYLNGVIRRHADRLSSVGIDPKLVDADVSALAAALGMVPCDE
jgi:hypothetical protein